MSDDLKQAVIEYLSEMDNPVPDFRQRHILRDHLRRLSGAPPEPRAVYMRAHRKKERKLIREAKAAKLP